MAQSTVQKVPCVSVQSSCCEGKSLETRDDLSGKILKLGSLYMGTLLVLTVEKNWKGICKGKVKGKRTHLQGRNGIKQELNGKTVKCVRKN